MKSRISIVFLLSIVISACSVIYDDKNVQWEHIKPEQFVVLHAVGYAPIEKQLGNNREEKLLQAVRASKIDAYRELAEQLYGHQLSSTTKVRDLVAKDDRIKSRVAGIVRGAKVIKSYSVGNNYVTELELDTELVYDLMQIQNPEKRIKKINYY